MRHFNNQASSRAQLLCGRLKRLERLRQMLENVKKCYYFKVIVFDLVEAGVSLKPFLNQFLAGPRLRFDRANFRGLISQKLQHAADPGPYIKPTLISDETAKL